MVLLSLTWVLVIAINAVQFLIFRRLSATGWPETVPTLDGSSRRNTRVAVRTLLAWSAHVLFSRNVDRDLPLQWLFWILRILVVLLIVDLVVFWLRIL